MLRSLKKISWILLLALGLQGAGAFSLLGPFPGFADYTPSSLPATFGDNWQVDTIGYGYPGSGDIGGPKNLGEQYRRNAQTYYYAFDANFLDFFGSNGVYAVSSAYTIMNNCLTNVDAYSTALTEFPLNSQSINYQASALGLEDLQSETLGALVELMGLANPVRFAWTLHDRYLPSGAVCPNYEYLVVARNFDITASPLNQLQYSPYVNGTLYSYYIEELCNPPVPYDALAVPVQVDPLQNSFAPVAGRKLSFVSFGGSFIDAGLQEGGFYTGLTRDDVAGLRYLLSTNLIAYESPATGSVLVNSSGPGGTNYGAPFLLYTLDLTTFVLAAQTNDPATLSNLYPGLIITSSAIHFSPQYITNGFVAYFTNLIGAPIGSQTLVVVPVVTYSILTTYTYTFANVVTNTYNANAPAKLLVVTVGPVNGAPAGSPLQTNVTAVPTTLTGIPSGDFFINTNACGPPLVLTNFPFPAVATTNLIYAASNSAGQFYSQSLVTYSNQSALVVLPIVCGASSGGGTTTNQPGLYRGIGKTQFVPTSYDSLIGQFYQPITNTYTQVLIINSKAVNQTFQRVVIVPDYLMSASDQATGPDAPPGDQVYFRGLNFNIANIAPMLAGPGTIDQLSDIIFNKAGLVYVNAGPGNQSSGVSLLNWASFDGSTNAPVLYPDGTSIDNLANEILVQISPATLPVGTNHVVYPSTTFVATGGAFSPPFTWSLVPGQGGLPTGLTLSSGGTISGTPTQTGTFDFTIELTDALSRTVTWNYALTIN